jgi:hypothetical protein
MPDQQGVIRLQKAFAGKVWLKIAAVGIRLERIGAIRSSETVLRDGGWAAKSFCSLTTVD